MLVSLNLVNQWVCHCSYLPKHGAQTLDVPDLLSKRFGSKGCCSWKNPLEYIDIEGILNTTQIQQAETSKGNVAFPVDFFSLFHNFLYQKITSRRFDTRHSSSKAKWISSGYRLYYWKGRTACCCRRHDQFYGVARCYWCRCGAKKKVDNVEVENVNQLAKCQSLLCCSKKPDSRDGRKGSGMVLPTIRTSNLSEGVHATHLKNLPPTATTTKTTMSTLRKSILL